GGARVIYDNISHTFDLVMSRYGNNWNLQFVVPHRIHRNDAVHAAVEKRLGIFLDQVSTMAVTGDKKEIVLLEQAVLDSAKHGSGVSLADFRNDHANSETAPRS